MPDPTHPPVLRTVAPGRSCEACRRRKIRCNRQRPCSYCMRLKTRCVYPGEPSSETAHRQIQEVDDVHSRLTQIEESLRQLRERQAVEQRAAPEALDFSDRDLHASQVNRPRESLDDVASDSQGSLVISGSSIRYIQGGFWAALESSISNLTTGADLETQLPSLQPPPPRTSVGPFTSFLGLPNIAPSDLSSFHPRPDRVFPLWQVYLEAVDPLTKPLHVRTTQRQLLQASQDPASVPPSFSALMFAIYHAGVCSMQTSTNTGTIPTSERYSLMHKYATGLEHALSQSAFLTHPDIFSLQAFIIYLICARTYHSRTLIWTLTGLAIRLATRLGLHHDPSTMTGVSFFDAAIRRRLWWALVVLDAQTAADNDVDPSFSSHTLRAVRIPANHDDSSLDPSMSSPPPSLPSSQTTEMLFPLRAIKLAQTARHVLFSHDFITENGNGALPSPEARLATIDTLLTHLQERDDATLDVSVPICAIVRRYTEMECARMKIAVLYAYHGTKAGSYASIIAAADTFAMAAAESAAEILRSCAVARRDPRLRKFLWLLEREAEWMAMAAVLRGMLVAKEACNGVDTGDEAERAEEDERWVLVQEVVERWRAVLGGSGGQDEGEGEGEGVVAEAGGDERWGLVERLFTAVAEKRAGA